MLGTKESTENDLLMVFEDTEDDANDNTKKKKKQEQQPLRGLASRTHDVWKGKPKSYFSNVRSDKNSHP